MKALEQAANEGRNVLPDATDDQASVIEQWALRALTTDEGGVVWHNDGDECTGPDCGNPSHFEALFVSSPTTKEPQP